MPCVLCCAVLCCAVLCCAVLCCTVLCCACFGLHSYCAKAFALYQKHMGANIAAFVGIVVGDVDIGAL